MSQWKDTDFSASSHVTLMAIITGTNGEGVVESGRRLEAAADSIAYAVWKLRECLRDVGWEGKDADTFRQWAHDLGTSGQVLADFVRAQGNSLMSAGGKIIQTRNGFPEIPTRTMVELEELRTSPNLGTTTDPAAVHASIAEKQAVIDRETTTARRMMSELASTYMGTVAAIAGAPKPEFRPPNGPYRPIMATEDEDLGGAAGVAAATAVALAGHSRSTGGIGSAGAPGQVPGMAGWPANPGLGVPPVVGSSVPPQVTTRLSHTSSSDGHGRATATSADAARPTGAASDPRTLPSATARPLTGAAPPNVESGSLGALGTTGRAAPGSGTVRGSTGSPLSNRPTTAGRTGSDGPRFGPGSPGLRADASEGTVARSGHLSPEGRPAQGRPGVPMGGAMGAPWSSAGASTPRTPRTGVTAVPGGVVGGSSARTSQEGQRPFSPGGSGLRTSGSVDSAGSSPGAPGHAGRPVTGVVGMSQGTPPADGRRLRQRADYLEEDEETWAIGPNPVPPVID